MVRNSCKASFVIRRGAKTNCDWLNYNDSSGGRILIGGNLVSKSKAKKHGIEIFSLPATFDLTRLYVRVRFVIIQ